MAEQTDSKRENEIELVQAVDDGHIYMVINALVKLKYPGSRDRDGVETPTIVGESIETLSRSFAKAINDIANKKFGYDYRAAAMSQAATMHMINFEQMAISYQSGNDLNVVRLLDEFKSMENCKYMARALILFIVKTYFKGNKQRAEELLETDAIYPYFQKMREIKRKDAKITKMYEKHAKQFYDVTAIPKIDPKKQLESFARARENTMYESSNLTALTSAYETYILTASLIFGFSVSLASAYSSDELFNNNVTLYLFQISISFCISSSFITLMILSLNIVGINRYIGLDKIHEAKLYLSETYYPRRLARISFVLCLVSFLTSLSFLFLNGLPTPIASINIVILVVGVAIVVVVKYKYKL